MAGLSFMKRLSPSVTYFDPNTSSVPAASPATPSTSGRRDPELILLLSWMGAREEHIAKYVHKHHSLFPTSRIIVAQCPLSHVFFPLLVYLHARPVIPILKELVDAKGGDVESVFSTSSDSKDPPRVLIHAFSNGGVSTAIQIYRQLKAALGGTLRLPTHVFLFDSCPGWFRWKSTAKAIGQKLPGWTAPIVHSLLFSVWMIYQLPFIQPAQNVNARLIRNPNYVKSEVRRTYLYGTRDDLIYPADVEEQAAQATKAGFDVRLEKFEGALHCAIARDHGERYWRVVVESWVGHEEKGELEQSGVLVDAEVKEVEDVPTEVEQVQPAEVEAVEAVAAVAAEAVSETTAVEAVEAAEAEQSEASFEHVKATESVNGVQEPTDVQEEPKIGPVAIESVHVQPVKAAEPVTVGAPKVESVIVEPVKAEEPAKVEAVAAVPAAEHAPNPPVEAPAAKAEVEAKPKEVKKSKKKGKKK